MAVDYTELASVAQELIEDNGRTVTLQKKSRTVQDVTKPWRGVTTTPVSEIAAIAVMFDVTDEQITPEATREDNRDLILRGDKMAVVASNSLTSATQPNLVGYDTFVDGAEIFQIISVETVKPGPTTLVYIIQLRV